MAQIVTLNVRERWVELADGQVLPLTHVYGPDKQETDDPDLAMTFVAGPDENGQWHAGTVPDHDPRRLN